MLDGALFFGTAEAAEHEIERLVHISDQIVLDFERVSEVDAVPRVLLQAADAVRRAGKHLLFAGLSPRNAPMRMIRDMDVHGRLADAFSPTRIVRSSTPKIGCWRLLRERQLSMRR